MDMDGRPDGQFKWPGGREGGREEGRTDISFANDTRAGSDALMLSEAIADRTHSDLEPPPPPSLPVIFLKAAFVSRNLVTSISQPCRESITQPSPADR